MSIGIVALALMLVAAFKFALPLQGRAIREYVATCDPHIRLRVPIRARPFRDNACLGLTAHEKPRPMGCPQVPAFSLDQMQINS